MTSREIFKPTKGYEPAEISRALHILGRAVLVRRHPYVRSPYSQAGNCWCGRAQHSTMHPHAFNGAENMNCVCGKPANWWLHEYAEKALGEQQLPG